MEKVRAVTDEKVKEASGLIIQLRKGAGFFSRHYHSGIMNPFAKSKLWDFEKSVVEPLDNICLKMTSDERNRAEAESKWRR